MPLWVTRNTNTKIVLRLHKRDKLIGEGKTVAWRLKEDLPVLWIPAQGEDVANASCPERLKVLGHLRLVVMQTRQMRHCPNAELLLDTQCEIQSLLGSPTRTGDRDKVGLER